ncbi:MAG: hypothetical protein GXX85_03450 [Ignavibacteria bacterium]|nr:hypothetical protein [Ignavibacteria bacterium]
MKIFFCIFLALFLVKCNTVDPEDKNISDITIKVKNSKNEELKDVKIYLVYNFINSLPKIQKAFSPDSVVYGGFSYDIDDNTKQVILKWTTTQEISNNKFIIQRREKNSSLWVEVGEVKGTGITNAPIDYTFTDPETLNGIFYYRIKQQDTDGKIKYYNEMEVVVITIAVNYNLLNNTPNPFLSDTYLRFTCPERSTISFEIKNPNTGKIVHTIPAQTYEAGSYSDLFSSKNKIPNGIYNLTMNATSLLTSVSCNHNIVLCKNNEDTNILESDMQNFSTDKNGNAKIPVSELSLGENIPVIDENSVIHPDKLTSNTLNLIFIKTGYSVKTQSVVIDTLNSQNIDITLSEE